MLWHLYATVHGRSLTYWEVTQRFFRFFLTSADSIQWSSCQSLASLSPICRIDLRSKATEHSGDGLRAATKCWRNLTARICTFLRRPFLKLVVLRRTSTDAFVHRRLTRDLFDAVFTGLILRSNQSPQSHVCRHLCRHCRCLLQEALWLWSFSAETNTEGRILRLRFPWRRRIASSAASVKRQYALRWIATSFQLKKSWRVPPWTISEACI